MIPCLGGNCYNGRMFGQLRAIAWITVLEALGHPATLLLTLASAAGTLALPLFQFQRFTEDGRLARDCGLATAMFFGVLLAAGGACRLTRALGDGTSAVALTKPVSRGLWLCGHALGTGVALMAYWLTQGAAVLLAEGFSPRYHTMGTYADVRGILISLAFLAAALVLAALNHRFRGGRFVLSAALLMPVLLWGRVLMLQGPHWGDLSALAALALGVAQAGALATALAVRCPPGMTVGLTLAAVAGAMVFLNGSAYLPLDALSGGGQVPWATLGWLVPQSVCAVAFFLWCGAEALRAREVA